MIGTRSVLKMNQHGSVGITLPPKWVRECDIEVGDAIIYQKMGDGSLKIFKEKPMDLNTSNLPGYTWLKEED